MSDSLEKISEEYDVTIESMGTIQYLGIGTIYLTFVGIPDLNVIERLKNFKSSPYFTQTTKIALAQLDPGNLVDKIHFEVKSGYNSTEVAEQIAVFLEQEHQLKILRKKWNKLKYDYETVGSFLVVSTEPPQQEISQKIVENSSSAPDLVSPLLDIEELLSEISWVRGNILRIGKYAEDLSGSSIDFDCNADRSALADEGKINWDLLDENDRLDRAFVIHICKPIKPLWLQADTGKMVVDYFVCDRGTWSCYWFERKAKALRKFFNYPSLK